MKHMSKLALGLVVLAMFLVAPVEICAQTTYLSSPSDGAQYTYSDNPAVTLYWYFSGGYSVGLYQVQLDNNSDFSSPELDITPGAGTTSHTVSGLSNGSIYYWRVRTSYWTGSYWLYTAWSDVRTFRFIVPRLVSPNDNATNVSQPLDFDWDGFSDPRIFNKGEQLLVATDISFNNVVLDVSTRNEHYTISAGTLDYETHYYWKVRHYFTTAIPPYKTTYYNWSAVWDFETGCDVPAAPTLSSPVNGASDLSQPIVLSWSEADIADKYNIQIADNPSFSPAIKDNLIYTTTYNASGLDDGTTYYWRVRAGNDCGWGDFTDSRNFTTECPPPGTPVLTAPADGTTDLSLPFTCYWNTVADADYYQIQIDDVSNFGSPNIDEQPSQAQFQVVSGLLDGEFYYWRVRAHSNCGWGSWTSYRTFTMECPLPGVPSLELPPDGVADLEQPVTLDWSDVATATKYNVQVDDSPGFGSPEIDNQNVGSSQYSASGLTDDMQFYWRVRAYNNCGWGNWSDVRDFSTECPVLAAPTLQSPADNQTGLDVRVDVTVDWSDVSGANNYGLQVSNNAEFTALVVDNSPVASEHTIGYPLQADQWYYWRVRTQNVCGWGDWSTYRRFQCYCPTAGVPSLVSPVDGQIDIAQPIILDWDDVAEAEEYHVQVDNDFNFSSLDVDATEVVPSELSLPTLLFGINYYWRVQAYNGCGWSDWSDVRSFTPGEQTDVRQIAGDDLPENYILKQNYPNPFNSGTTIEFALPNARYVTIDIHNILGEKVETPVSRSMSAGYYSVTWDASDVPSGVYFYRLKAGDYTETRKMTLLK